MNLKPKFFREKTTDFKIHHHDKHVHYKLIQQIKTFLPKNQLRPIVIVCIGTDRSTGDALGPIIGTKLQEKNRQPYFVYGTLENPIHAVNLNEELKAIKQSLPNPFIIGIDACLGQMSSVGMISLGEGPVKPGAAVNKELTPVGDIHLTGIVNVSGFMEYFILQNTRLNIVMKLSNIIADSLHMALMTHTNNQSYKDLNIVK